MDVQRYLKPETVLQAIGVLAVGRVVLTLLRVLYDLILPGMSLQKFGANNGAWAVVTGATDGIGKEFALQLAKTGFNLLLVSRNQVKLDAVAAEIRSASPSAETKTLAIDFARAQEKSFVELESLLKDMNVGVLVNNVGVSHEMPVDFVETTREEMDSIISVNISGTLRITSLVLPSLLRRRGTNGLVLTLGSFAGEIPSPMLATYSGSKSFLSTWSDALASELRPHGVLVRHLNTYFVVSSMSKIRRRNWLVPTPKAYVASVLGSIGRARGAVWTGRPASSTAYWSHALADSLMNLVGLRSLFIWYTHGLHRSIRKRALRKKLRDAKQE